MNRHLLGDRYRCLMGQAPWKVASTPRGRIIDSLHAFSTPRPTLTIATSLRPCHKRHSSIYSTPYRSQPPLIRSYLPAHRTLQIGLHNPIRTQITRPALKDAVIFRVQFGRRWTEERWSSSDTKPPGDAPKSTSAPQSVAHQDGHAATTAPKGSAKHLFNRLPHIHRPTKQELLAAATGFWHRLQIRFKWFSIRSARPFNSEEIFTFISWIFWGHVLWVVIGTTTFVSLAILAINTVFAQETLARWVGAHLTRSIGVQIVFENAIVPNWRDGVISFKNVFISRRPSTNPRRNSVSKGSPTSAAAAAAAALADQERQRNGLPANQGSDPVDDGNYSQFDLTVDSISVSLSFAKWFNGKGLLRDVEVRGVRGVIDRTHVKPRTVKADPKSFRREHRLGDFEIDNFRLDDVLLTIHQPGGFRPFQLSIFNCELPRLRKQWLFYDFLSANNMSGSFDNSLFTIHPRQVHGYTGVPLVEGREDDASIWKKHSRLRVDGLKIDHLNRGVQGPFSWIYEGNVDIVADIMLPNDADGTIAKVMSDFYDRMEATVNNSQLQNSLATNNSLIINNRDDPINALQASNASSTSTLQTSDSSPPPDRDARFLIFDLNIQLNDVRASVPLFPRELSYVSNALVRPIVAYINSHSSSARGNTFIPINCRVVKHAPDFDGSWTIFDSGLLDDVSREIYTAFVRDIRDRKHRQRRIKKVATWAAQVAAQALFIGLAGQLA